MKPFIHDDFLLRTDAARALYHQFAKDQPIYDYHCHIPPADVAANREFRNLADIWLAGDHYKWRAMRSNGVPETYCTGDASDWEKFEAWAATVPHTLGNPLYHWTHLELKRVFGIDTLLHPGTAKAIWDEANRVLATDDGRVHGILKRFRVAVIGTTDDPTDTLEHHQAIRASDLPTRVYPSFRPDKALRVDDPAAWNAWVNLLSSRSGLACDSLRGLEEALADRHGFFHDQGSRLSDHGLECALAEPCTQAEAEAIFAGARGGRAATPAETAKFGSYLMRTFGRLDAARGWTKQMHLGAMRNNSTRQFRALGPDTGFDSIGDRPQGQALSRYLDSLDLTGELPKTVLYNLNPADNYLFATMIGNFQDGSVPGKIQFGSGWWFLDQKEAMEWQIRALSNLGLLSRFVGMLTDSRSFLSYPRHEYFRRILCNLLGQDMEHGEIPDDLDRVGALVRDICFHNAVRYFGMEPGPV